jgi:cation diffusion facilitator CzcD-associated flavoprotein CzcO/acetyl esterase/lipase
MEQAVGTSAGGISSGRGRPRLPAGVVRRALRATVRPALSPRAPLWLQRATVDSLGWLPLPRAVRTHTTVLGGVPAMSVTGPGAEHGRAVLYLHGGGFVTGSPRGFRGLAAALSTVAGAPVWLVDYRLAPEHPYPAGLDDTVTAYRALLAAGLPAERIVLAGDSAGGNLALSAALRLRAAGDPLPAGLVLISPWLDLALTGESITGQAGVDAVLREPWLRSCARTYQRDQSPADPLFADLAGLPPTLVLTGERELLVSDSERFVERAGAAGVPVTYHCWPRMWHDFPIFAGLLTAADEAVDRIGAGIRGFFAAAAERPGPGAEPAAAGVAGGQAAGVAGGQVAGAPAEPVRVGRREPRVAIVGAGFGGIGLAIELTRRGHRDFVMIDKADRIGGVWRENTYPGAACDIPSIQYCFSSDPRPDWPRRYSGQADIVAYLQDCVTRYGLTDHLRLNTEVAAASYQDGRWVLRTAAGERIEADLLAFACGQLNRPSYPDIPGLDQFGGTMFHSALWRHDHDLAGRDVAVIGTGPSALQFVPAIAPNVGRLTVYQRTPTWVLAKMDGPYTPAQHERARRNPNRLAAARRGWDAFEEYLTLGITRHRALLTPFKVMSRAMLRQQVQDPATRAKLTPTIEFGCKRVGFSNDWYPTFNLPTVDLVTESIEAVTRTGITTTAGSREHDTIILGTGFTATEFLAPIQVHGAGGKDLAEVWKDGARAYLGLAVAGFPNMFLMYGPNTNLGSGSIVMMLEAQARYIAGAVDLLADRTVGELDLRCDVDDAYAEEVQRRLAGTAWVSCNSWYSTESGRVTTNWPGALREYRRRTARLELSDYRAGH